MAGVQVSRLGSIAGVQVSRLVSIAGVQVSRLGSIGGVQVSRLGSKAGVQVSRLGSKAGVQDFPYLYCVPSLSSVIQAGHRNLLEFPLRPEVILIALCTAYST